MSRQIIASTGNINTEIVVKANANFNELYVNGAINVIWFGAVDDIDTDSRAAFVAALAVSKHIYIPETTSGFKISTPIEAPNGMIVTGSGKSWENGSEYQSKIYAPEGLFINSNTTEAGQRHINISNLYLYGQGKAISGKIAIKGNFNGYFNSISFTDFDTAISMSNAWSSLFQSCDFRYLQRGIYLSTAHDCIIRRNNFEVWCDVQLDLQEPNGLEDGVSVNIYDNKFNIEDHTTVVLSGLAPIKLAGNFSFHDNYLESYGVAATFSSTIEVIISRFGNYPFSIYNNSIGCNNVNYQIILKPDNVSGAFATSGSFISNNKFSGSIVKDIRVESSTGGVKLQEDASVEISNVDSNYTCVPFNIQLDYTAGILDVSSANNTEIPYTLQSGYIARMNANHPKTWSGRSLMVDITVVAKYTSSLPNFEIQIAGAGATIAISKHSLIYGGIGDNYATIRMSAMLKLSYNQSIQIFAKNGGIIHSSLLQINEIVSQSNIVEYTP